jgi:signal transduction histidine kinase
MRSFRDIPIRRKLTLIIMLTSGIGLLLAGTLTVLYERDAYRRLMTDDMLTLAEIIGDQSAAALAFSDPKAAQENLSALQRKPEILAAAIYSPDGRIFTQWKRADQNDIVVPTKASAAGHRFESGQLLLFKSINTQGEILGTVYLCSGLGRLQAHLLRSMSIVAVVIISLLLVTLILSNVVQRAISDPILNLAKVARVVSEDKNYAIRASGKGHDEIGQLIKTFNQMLTQIEESDTALRDANAALQTEVIERKRTDAALHEKSEEARSMTQQLWQTAKLATMGELAASIAHELNNPLATVTLKIESLIDELDEDDPKRRSLEIVEQEVDRMGGLISQLLQFSRRSQQQTSTIDIREEVKKTLELVHFYLNKRSIVVTTDFAPDLPPIHADRQQLRQLFLNLFTNASDAMVHGGNLAIAVRSADGQVLTTVTDTGAGISPENLPAVMEPFFTTKPEGKGTGLGLGICRRIVQDHRGTFEIESEVGKGTTIKVALPASSGIVDPEH